jgi:maltooligosyltrehalose trehalohydrolase
VRRLPVGAEVVPGEGVHFRVWAPASDSAAVEWSTPGKPAASATRTTPLEAEAGGYFSGFVPGALPGMNYKFRLAGGCFPDPASRFQPEGPHGPSQVIDAGEFQWTDKEWRGLNRRGQVIYELHIGTFTNAGTWQAAVEQLPELVRLGVTTLEVMPVADFVGSFGWGYDGVNLFAPTRLYGVPDDFRMFVDRAHGLGLGVILDVVYNHFGPDGNYLKQFSKDYFTDRYQNEWGEAINFDGENSGPVREFVLANAAYWIEEFHLDGLRLDATQQIYDGSEEHILAEVNRQVRRAARGRSTYITAENEPQQVRLLRPFDQGGFALDSMWNDDFHHSASVGSTGRREAYFSDYQGTPQELVATQKWGFLYQGQWYSWQKQRRGTPTMGIEPERFVNFLQNHDQIANSLRGLRLHQLTSPGRLRALTALLLLGPGTPMLFQGQEFGASAPFLFFADHQPELARLVRLGRGTFLKQFPSSGAPEAASYQCDPAARDTFLRCKLDWSEREQGAGLYQLHRDLLKLRREDPVFSQPRSGGLDGAVLGPEAFGLRFFGRPHGDRLLLVNLGLDLEPMAMPEPLLAPPENCAWTLEWSSESPVYGGCGTPELRLEGRGRIPGHAAMVLRSEGEHGESNSPD